MPRHLVIVESPAKARTLGRMLGGGYAVHASLGHVRDLPRERLGVDPARGFAPEYEVRPARRRVLAQLREAARAAETVTLAGDPDREGEAICWHLAEALGGDQRRFRRVAFHELTPRAVEQAFRAPGAIDHRRVDAQQARRILDRLVGYSLSPLLWQRLGDGLSAGRVQSVALRIVCERERERAAFVAEERWTLRVRLDAGAPPVFPATLVAVDGAQPRLGGEREARILAARLQEAAYRVVSVVERPRLRPPAPPFTTSTLQQEAFRRLGFSVSKAMQLAQRLYEGVELAGEGAVGLVTYVRTDSTAVAPEAVAAAREHVARSFGADHLPPAANQFSPPPGAQLAHEAIRPTDLARTPAALDALLTRDEAALYRLVYERFVASQMAPAVYDETQVEIEALAAAVPPQRLGLRARGRRLRFRGFLAVQEPSSEGGPPADAPDADAEVALPPLSAGQPLALVGVEPQQRFTEPPPRFTEASLVRELERCGIGRPSTYAATLATLFERQYVRRTKGRLSPTPLGFSVADLLVERFPELMSVGYTAQMEEGLDAIEAGRATLLGTLAEFWARFAPALEAARLQPGEPPRRGSPPAPASAVGACPACASPLVEKQGRHGPFVGCSRYPRCRHVEPRPARPAGVRCPRCHEGAVVERRAERAFFGCSRYPACRFTSSHRPLAESCPECGAPCLFERQAAGGGRVVLCGADRCHYHRDAADPDRSAG